MSRRRIVLGLPGHGCAQWPRLPRAVPPLQRQRPVQRARNASDRAAQPTGQRV